MTAENSINYSGQRHGKFLYPEDVPEILQQGYEMKKHMVLATIRMAIPPQKRSEALKILRSIVELCRDDPAWLSCHIYGDLQDKKVLVLEEIWKSEEGLDPMALT